MSDFSETNLIVAQGKNVFQINTLEELIDRVFGDEYKNLSKKEKLNQRYKDALLHAVFNNMDIVYSPKGIVKEDKTFDTQKTFDMNNSFVIDDETTFLLSLCKVDDLRILERKDSSIFISDEDRDELEGQDGNYVIVNKRVDKIMNRYLQWKIEKEGPEL